MRNVETINNEIEALKKKMAEVKGTDTEVYTRIVGYYRAVKNWNKGKRDEYNKRKLFSQPGRTSMKEAAAAVISTTVSNEPAAISTSKSIAGNNSPESYIYFYRTTCPNCPPVRNWLENFFIEGEAVNVDDESGFELASEYSIFSSPTVVFLDEEKNEISRASDVKTLDAMFETVAV